MCHPAGTVAYFGPLNKPEVAAEPHPTLMLIPPTSLLHSFAGHVHLLAAAPRTLYLNILED